MQDPWIAARKFHVKIPRALPARNKKLRVADIIVLRTKESNKVPVILNETYLLKSDCTLSVFYYVYRHKKIAARL